MSYTLTLALSLPAGRQASREREFMDGHSLVKDEKQEYP